MKSHIINKEALSNYFKEHRGKIALINLIILILEQIRDWLEGNQQQQSPKPFSLEDYESLNLTDEQIRKAIVQLRAEHLLTRKVDWLGVLKVLLWTRLLVDDYGRYTKLEAYLKRLFPNDHRLDGVANSLSKKCRSNSFFKNDLECWMMDKRQDRYGIHLRIAQRILSLLQAG